jgi:hypothetical protein
MDALIKNTLENGIADQLGLLPGDRMLSINGNSGLEDLFD